MVASTYGLKKQISQKILFILTHNLIEIIFFVLLPNEFVFKFKVHKVSYWITKNKSILSTKNICNLFTSRTCTVKKKATSLFTIKPFGKQPIDTKTI